MSDHTSCNPACKNNRQNGLGENSLSNSKQAGIFTAHNRSENALDNDDKLITVFYGVNRINAINSTDASIQTELFPHSPFVANLLDAIPNSHSDSHSHRKSPVSACGNSGFYSALTQARIFWTLIAVLLLHIILIVLVNYFWNVSEQTKPKESVAAIQSYLYVAPLDKTILQTEHSQIEMETEKTIKAEADELERVNTVDNVTVASTKQASTIKAKPDTKPAEDLAPKMHDKIKEIQPEKATETAEYKTDKIQSNNLNHTSVTSGYTQSYLQRQRVNQLDELVANSAAQYTQKRSLSEMDGDMQELIFLQEDEYSKIITTQHRLDPNRVVKHGDDCYRVVKNGNQINPYAENLGYWFNCGEDKVKKAMNESIDKRLEQRMISR
ncbi:hypothetical protein MSG37_19610 [Shewanella sp. 1CM18E]|uniref:hypothetical protein n=1 Tax=Shewanella sp. 1CM18E TaxID=2929169 RepID=UPI0020BEBCEA|nr:hypothetical protein [Shewanella sp. 1CM18E]MCK8047098.1 hypothetical protein [Shewanella sp. 1CM18E]